MVRSSAIMCCSHLPQGHPNGAGPSSLVDGGVQTNRAARPAYATVENQEPGNIPSCLAGPVPALGCSRTCRGYSGAGEEQRRMN